MAAMERSGIASLRVSLDQFNRSTAQNWIVDATLEVCKALNFDELAACELSLYDTDDTPDAAWWKYQIDTPFIDNENDWPAPVHFPRWTILEASNGPLVTDEEKERAFFKPWEINSYPDDEDKIAKALLDLAKAKAGSDEQEDVWQDLRQWEMRRRKRLIEALEEIENFERSVGRRNPMDYPDEYVDHDLETTREVASRFSDWIKTLLFPYPNENLFGAEDPDFAKTMMTVMDYGEREERSQFLQRNRNADGRLFGNRGVRGIVLRQGYMSDPEERPPHLEGLELWLADGGIGDAPRGPIGLLGYVSRRPPPEPPEPEVKEPVSWQPPEPDEYYDYPDREDYPYGMQPKITASEWDALERADFSIYIEEGVDWENESSLHRIWYVTHKPVGSIYFHGEMLGELRLEREKYNFSEKESRRVTEMFGQPALYIDAFLTHAARKPEVFRFRDLAASAEGNYVFSQESWHSSRNDDPILTAGCRGYDLYYVSAGFPDDRNPDLRDERRYVITTSKRAATMIADAAGDAIRHETHGDEVRQVWTKDAKIDELGRNALIQLHFAESGTGDDGQHFLDLLTYKFGQFDVKGWNNETVPYDQDVWGKRLDDLVKGREEIQSAVTLNISRSKRKERSRFSADTPEFRLSLYKRVCELCRETELLVKDSMEKNHESQPEEGRWNWLMESATTAFMRAEDLRYELRELQELPVETIEKETLKTVFPELKEKLLGGTPEGREIDDLSPPLQNSAAFGGRQRKISAEAILRYLRELSPDRYDGVRAKREQLYLDIQEKFVHDDTYSDEHGPRDAQARDSYAGLNDIYSNEPKKLFSELSTDDERKKSAKKFGDLVREIRSGAYGPDNKTAILAELERLGISKKKP